MVLRERPIRQFAIKGQTFDASPLAPGLYLAATPIGNLGDITLRVLEALAAADLIACEDTRVTGKLLKHFSIAANMTPYHEHNAETAGAKLAEQIGAGKSVVLVSDAGTPLVSDPGHRLVALAREKRLPIVPLPGASAPLAALVASGLPGESWSFNGFLPAKQHQRRNRLETCLNATGTRIFFESPNRLIRTLEDMKSLFGAQHEICVARELTKMFEQIDTGSIEQILEIYTGTPVKGEIVILVPPVARQDRVDLDAVLTELLKTMTVSRASAEAAALTGLAKREVYRTALRLKNRF